MPEIYLTKTSIEFTENITRFSQLAFPTSVHFISDFYRNTHLGLWAPSKRMVDKLLLGVKDEISFDIDKSLEGFILAAGNTTFAGARLHIDSRGGPLDYELKTKAFQCTQMTAGYCANYLGISGHISTDSSACTSSMKALMDAYHLFTVHNFERVAILATEDQLNLGLLDFFGVMNIYLNQKDLDAGMKPSAFDAINRGFLLGQGGVAIWLETKDSLKKTGNRPIAKLLSSVITGEIFQNFIGQDPQGSGYKKAIEWALKVAKCSPNSIDLIKTHGTGTLLNNKAESTALMDIFGENFLATSYKPRIGHTFGASGLLESVLAIHDARNKIVRGIPNRTATDSIFLSNDISHKVNRILALSAGMGNVYGAAIWEIFHEMDPNQIGQSS